jgi:hypothetical protein
MTDFEDLWHWQDEIETVVNALGYTIWSLRPDADSGTLRMELCQHLDENEASALCYQLPLPTSYEGAGPHGSIFLSVAG